MGDERAGGCPDSSAFRELVNRPNYRNSGRDGKFAVERMLRPNGAKCDSPAQRARVTRLKKIEALICGLTMECRGFMGLVRTIHNHVPRSCIRLFIF